MSHHATIYAGKSILETNEWMIQKVSWIRLNVSWCVALYECSVMYIQYIYIYIMFVDMYMCVCLSPAVWAIESLLFWRFNRIDVYCGDGCRYFTVSVFIPLSLLCVLVFYSFTSTAVDSSRTFTRWFLLNDLSNCNRRCLGLVNMFWEHSVYQV